MVRITAVATARTSALSPGAAPTDPAGSAAYVTSLVDGWSLGFVVAGGLLALAAVVLGSLVKVSREDAVRALQDAPAGV